MTECSPPFPVRISRMCKKVTPHVSTLVASRCPISWNLARYTSGMWRGIHLGTFFFFCSVLFFFLSLSLSLFPLYIQPPVQNVRMWHSVLGRTGLGIVLGIVLVFSELVRLKARCCCCYFSVPLVCLSAAAVAGGTSCPLREENGFASHAALLFVVALRICSDCNGICV